MNANKFVIWQKQKSVIRLYIIINYKLLYPKWKSQYVMLCMFSNGLSYFMIKL